MVSTGSAGRVELVFELAGELLDSVFCGDQADGGAIFVNDDGHVAAALLEVADQVEDGLGLGRYEHVAHDLGEPQLE